MKTVEKKCAVCGESMQVDSRWENGEVSHWKCAYDACKEARDATEKPTMEYIRKFMK